MSSRDPMALALQIDRLMRRLNARIHVQAPEFDQHRVGPIGGMILLTLAEVQPAPIQLISRLMGRDKGQLSRLFSNLERRDLVSRTPDPDDQRSNLLRLTPMGEAFVESIKVVVDGAVQELLAPLTEDEKAEMLRLLEKI